MENMKSILLISSIPLLLASVQAFGVTHKNPDEILECHLFSGDKLIEKESCLHLSGTNEEGFYIKLRTSKAFYEFDGSCDSKGKCSYVQGTTPIETYVRNATTYKRIEGDSSSYYGNLLYCYKSADNKFDICAK
ncbi:hypothetical protein [Psychrobacter sp. UBA3962]|uniref:hypothetical protein n=1 Tax=Psychrobacter sp. UBA3962 TaxID=1947352 RepID=UPI0025D35C9F|nr:hypothetical protein [Psychrobacter sp. UBA3962]